MNKEEIKKLFEYNSDEELNKNFGLKELYDMYKTLNFYFGELHPNPVKNKKETIRMIRDFIHFDNRAEALKKGL